jgi:hypothetical protein
VTDRRLPLLVVVLVGLAALVVVGRDRPVPAVASFAEPPRRATPIVPGGELVTSTWFCPGVPASGTTASGEEGGEVIVANPSDVDLTGRLTILRPDGPPVVEEITVPPRERLVVDVDELVTAVFASALVELDGGRGVVEQRALHPAGAAVAPCANTTSPTWYFADGFTAEGSTERLVLTNPFPAPAIVDIGFVTRQGPRAPSSFQGYVVPARSVRVIGLAEAGARDEPVLAVKIEAASGQLVAAKAQHFVGGGRRGFVMALGAPALDDQWWFADGARGEGVSEQYVVYNPTAETVEADLVILGVDPVEGFIEASTLTIPAGEVAVFDTSGIAGLPDGPHGAVVSTLASDSVVVERVLTQPAGDGVATAVVLGAQTLALSGRWYAITSTELAIEDVIVVLNTSFTEGTVQVKAIGPGGEVAVPGLESIPLPANGIVSIDLTSPLAFGRPLVIESTLPIVVERRLERDPNLRGRSGSLAIAE